jgi:hypothetical protein
VLPLTVAPGKLSANSWAGLFTGGEGQSLSESLGHPGSSNAAHNAAIKKLNFLDIFVLLKKI